MQLVYITPIFLPSPLSGSEELILQCAKGIDAPIVITSNIRTRIGYFLPFIGKYTKREEIIDGITIIRISHKWEIYLCAQFAVYLFKFVLHIPLLGRIHNIKKASVTATSYAYGIIFRNLEKELLLLKPDIIHVTPIPHAYTYQAVNSVKKINQEVNLNIKIVLTPALHFSSDILSSTYNLDKVRDVLRLVDTIICTTQFEKNQIIKYFSIKPDMITVVPIGISDAMQKEHKASLLISQIDTIRRGRRIILFLGTRSVDKGLFTLIRGLRLVAAKESILLLVGGQSTLLWKIWITWVHISKKYPYVINLPYLTNNEKQYLFSISDIFALPSRVDSFGIVYLEAMRYALPIIYANQPPQKEVIGKAGLAREFGDSEGMQKDILALLHSFKLSKKHGTFGKDLFNNKYTQRIMQKRIREIYEATLSSS